MRRTAELGAEEAVMVAFDPKPPSKRERVEGWEIASPLKSRIYIRV